MIKKFWLHSKQDRYMIFRVFQWCSSRNGDHLFVLLFVNFQKFNWKMNEVPKSYQVNRLLVKLKGLLCKPFSFTTIIVFYFVTIKSRFPYIFFQIIKISKSRLYLQSSSASISFNTEFLVKVVSKLLKWKTASDIWTNY